MVLGHDLSKGQRTQDVRISQDVSFDTMLLKRETLKGLNKAGFLKPSPIQLHGIPLGKCGFDLLLEAKSGTGKTAVFTVISLEKLDLNIGVQAIILAPTREIAMQISDVISAIGYYYKGLNVAVVMGGIPFKDDVVKFSKHVHIVVGSPGRLRHLITENQINVSSVRLFVLDEADKLMESSFQPDINYIFSLLPKEKQVIMASATYPEETKTFIAKYVQKAQHVCPNTHSVLLGIEQKVTYVPHHSNIVKQTQHRYNVLKKILTEKQFKQCLIFCNYQARVGELHRMLERDKWPTEQLYGQQEQMDRLDALKTLQDYKCRILISTDLAARGIDAANVDLVINFEPPFEWQTYLHRIGRAGRYGSYGTAITILSEGKESKKFKETLRQTNMPFDIRNFWNNESFDLSVMEDSVEESVASANMVPETTIKVDNKNENSLWVVLISDSSKQKQDDKKDIVSFEVLCKSFEMSTKPQVESFSDLMNSFSVSNKSKASKQIESKYSHVKVHKLAIDKEHLISLGAHFTVKNSDHSDKTENTDIKHENRNSHTKDMPSSIENTACLSEIVDEKQRNSENCKSNESDDDIHVEVTKNDISNSHTCVKQNQNLRRNSEEIDVNQALIDAGLPSSFGKNIPKPIKVNNKSSYYKKSHVSNNNNENTKRNWEKPKDQQNQKEIENIRAQLKKDIYRRSITVDKFDESVTTKQINQPEYSSKIRYMDQPVIKSRKDYTEHRSNAQCYQNNAEKHCNSQLSQNRSKEFDTWYSKLKCQTQYIQYALYIEELRKL